MQPSPPGRASGTASAASSGSLDAGRKRAGTWFGTDIDLDQFRNTKRYKGQEIAWDLGTLHLAGGAPAACPTSGTAAVAHTAAAAVAAAPSGGPSPDPPDSPMLSADMAGSPMRQSQCQAWPAAQAMQCTPRSESRTPSVQAGPGGGGGGAVAAGGGGGQPSVQSAGLRSRLAVGHTPVRLSDALGLQLHPTSPSDPGLEGQTDLRKVTLMRRLQTRLLRAGADEAAAVSPPPGRAPPAEQQQAQQQLRQQDEQQPPGQQQQSGGLPSLLQSPAGGPLLQAQAAAAAAAAAGSDDSPPMQGPCPGAAAKPHAFATPSGQLPRPQQREPPDGGSCSMQVSPAAAPRDRL